MDWMGLLYVLAAGLMVWLIFRMVRGNPEAFKKESLGKSLHTLGWLALLLMGVVAFCVFLLKT